MNMLSRKNEYEADAFASTTYNAQPLIDALKKLSVSSLSNLTPHPAFVFMNYSHPPLLQRLNAMEAFLERLEKVYIDVALIAHKLCDSIFC